jgi:hypothetical protein
MPNKHRDRPASAAPADTGSVPLFLPFPSAAYAAIVPSTPQVEYDPDAFGESIIVLDENKVFANFPYKDYSTLIEIVNYNPDEQPATASMTVTLQAPADSAARAELEAAIRALALAHGCVEITVVQDRGPTTTVSAAASETTARSVQHRAGPAVVMSPADNDRPVGTKKTESVVNEQQKKGRGRPRKDVAVPPVAYRPREDGLRTLGALSPEERLARRRAQKNAATHAWLKRKKESIPQN